MAEHLAIAFPPEWLESHALTRAALEDEARRVHALGIRLELGVFRREAALMHGAAAATGTVTAAR